MLVNQDKELMSDATKIIRYVQNHPCKIVYRPVQPDGQPVENDVELENALVIGPTYHGLGIRAKTEDGMIVAIQRDQLISITQPKVAGGLGKSIYFGEAAPIQTFGVAGDIHIDATGKVMEKQEKWVEVMTVGGSGATTSSTL